MNSPAIPIVILLGVGVFLEQVFTGVIGALGYALVVVAVVLLLIWLLSIVVDSRRVR